MIDRHKEQSHIFLQFASDMELTMVTPDPLTPSQLEMRMALLSR